MIFSFDPGTWRAQPYSQEARKQGSKEARKQGSREAGKQASQEAERPGAAATDLGFRQSGEDGLPFLEEGRGYLCPSRSTHRVMHSVGSALGAGKLWITRTWPTPLRCCGDGISTDGGKCHLRRLLYTNKYTSRRLQNGLVCIMRREVSGPPGRCTGVMDQAVSRGTLLCRCVATASTLPSAAAPYPQPRPDTDCVVLR